MVNLSADTPRYLLATDLDGTILSRGGSFNPDDLSALEQLGDKGVVRVVATGRTIHSALKALPDDFPVDYLVFSSGAGVLNFKSRELMRTLHLHPKDTSAMIAHLTEKGLGFTLHHAIPENHKFWYHLPQQAHPDFERYLSYNASHASSLEGQITGDRSFSQLLTFLPDEHAIDEICGELEDVKWVRATSPIDGESVWIEFFHPGVSKASGIAFVSEYENIPHENVWVLGNDFNDLDMLHTYAPRAFVVENAPEELKKHFKVVPSVTDGGLAHLVKGI